MSDKIIEAVEKLDVTNDNHWTADGLPRLETIRILTSNPSLSREDVNNAMPGFKRIVEAAPNSAQANEAVNLSTPSAPPITAQPAQAQAQPTTNDLPVLNQNLAVETNDLESLQSQLADAQAEYEDATFDLAEAKARCDKAQNDFARLEAQVSSLTLTNEGSPIQAYLAQQNKDLEERRERQIAIQESGLTVKDIVTQGRSALDQAFASRRNRQRGIRS